MKYKLEQSDIYAFAARLGIDTRAKGNEIKFQYCPYCKSSSHDQWTFSINAVAGALRGKQITINCINLLHLRTKYGIISLT